MAETDIKNAGQLGDELKNALRLPNIAEFENAFERISSVARGVNNLFGQSRERINELKTSLADSLPGIVRLGGNLENVGKTIEDIALASRRNIIANSEDIEKLYASFKVTGLGISEIAEGFLNVGVGLEQMGEQLEDSVNYVRSIGGNTQQVMRSVRDNMDQMNRYQFEGGVQGLTKMAAQASMLRFDMSETFRLADDVLDPNRAIEVASAFQRLGVSAGDLADPFQLMNQAINDPSGLQDSLANVAKQFTYFDEKTKTFKINPQGVLTLREMQNQTQVSAKEMSKMGLAAAELDARLSEISSAGLSIASEEDKQYLANIATMRDGKYIVTLDDKTEKELAELTQPEFDKLIDQQKKAPKTMEEIAKSQMTISEDIAGNVEAIRAAFVGGMVTQKDLLNAAEAARKVSSTVTGDVSRNLSSPGAVREAFGESIGDFTKLLKDLKKGDSLTDALSEYLEKFGNQGIKVQEGLKESLIKGLEESRQKLKKDGSDSTIKEISEEFLGTMINGIKSGKAQVTDKENMSEYSLITGTKSKSVETQMAMAKVRTSESAESKVKVDGGFKIELVYPPNSDFTPSQKESINKAMTEWAKNWANSTNFQQYMINVTTPDNLIKGTSVNVLT